MSGTTRDPEDFGNLCNWETREPVQPATEDERHLVLSAEEYYDEGSVVVDGVNIIIMADGRATIDVDGARCYIEDQTHGDALRQNRTDSAELMMLRARLPVPAAVVATKIRDGRWGVTFGETGANVDAGSEEDARRQGANCLPWPIPPATSDCAGPWQPAPGYDDLYGPLACEAHGVECLSPEVQASIEEWLVDSTPEAIAADIEAGRCDGFLDAILKAENAGESRADIIHGAEGRLHALANEVGQ